MFIPQRHCLRYKLITHPMEGEKVRRIGRICLQFLPQFENVVIHRSGTGIRLVAPNRIEKLVAGKNPAGILYHVSQCFKFFVGEFDGFTVTDYFPACEVDHYAVKRVERIGSRGSRSPD